MIPHMMPLVYPKELTEDNIYLFNYIKAVNEPIANLKGVTTSAKAFRKTYTGVVLKYAVNLGVHILGYGPYDGCTSWDFSGGIPFKAHTASSKKASPKCIRSSVKRLKGWATTAPDITFHLPMPCLKGSTLTFAEVVEMYSHLPDNVHVYMLSKG